MIVTNKYNMVTQMESDFMITKYSSQYGIIIDKAEKTNCNTQEAKRIQALCPLPNCFCPLQNCFPFLQIDSVGLDDPYALFRSETQGIYFFWPIIMKTNLHFEFFLGTFQSTILST